MLYWNKNEGSNENPPKELFQSHLVNKFTESNHVNVKSQKQFFAFLLLSTIFVHSISW